MSHPSTKVMIVDDDEAVLRILEHPLLRAGYTVITASGGTMALQQLTEEEPDIVITDWMMPDMDGLELCSHIRASERGWTYTIILTAHGDVERMVQALDAGADDYLHKPLDERELLARVRVGERMVALKISDARKTQAMRRQNVELERINRELKEANRRLDEKATTDELTGLPNRRAALDRLGRFWRDGNGPGSSMSCAILDIDHFKSFNDRYGHSFGDLVLIETARTISENIRDAEFIFRIGGEEFLLLCPRANTAMAAAAADRLRSAIESMTISQYGVDHRITLSAGVAERTPSMKGPDDLVRAADDALYDAKDAGRNCVRLSVQRNPSVEAPRNEQRDSA